jgi:hypothetical protein
LRFSRSEIHRFVVEQAVSQASASTIGRWLAEDANRHGAIGRGSSRAIPTSSRRPAASSTSTQTSSPSLDHHEHSPPLALAA